MINLHRGGLPVGHPSPNDDGIIAMHLLAYVAIKYPEEYCPTVVGAVNGRSFGRIDFKKDGATQSHFKRHLRWNNLMRLLEIVL